MAAAAVTSGSVFRLPRDIIYDRIVCVRASLRVRVRAFGDCRCVARHCHMDVVVDHDGAGGDDDYDGGAAAKTLRGSVGRSVDHPREREADQLERRFPRPPARAHAFPHSLLT